MAIVKVFDVEGVKVLKCFDTLFDVPYLLEEECEPTSEPEEED